MGFKKNRQWWNCFYLVMTALMFGLSPAHLDSAYGQGHCTTNTCKGETTFHVRFSVSSQSPPFHQTIAASTSTDLSAFKLVHGTVDYLTRESAGVVGYRVLRSTSGTNRGVVLTTIRSMALRQYQILSGIFSRFASADSTAEKLHETLTSLIGGAARIVLLKFTKGLDGAWSWEEVPPARVPARGECFLGTFLFTASETTILGR